MSGGGFGDIMGYSQDLPSHLSVSFSGIDRIVLTANGNLQRIISSYYNSPVSVRIVKNTKASAGYYHREVVLECMGHDFMTATSKVSLSSEELIGAVERREVGIGQLFRRYNLLPHFTLLKAQRNGDAYFRIYSLKAKGVECEICESFVSGLWGLSPKVPAALIPAPAVPAPAAAGTGGGHFGDLMSGTKTAFSVFSPEFSPLERVILTANGNVQRIISSYYNTPVYVIPVEKSGSNGVYHRQVKLSCLGQVFCTASTKVRVTSPDILNAVESNRVELPEIFRTFDLLPEFRLTAAKRNESNAIPVEGGGQAKGDGRGASGGSTSKEGGSALSTSTTISTITGEDDHGFWREYELVSEGVSCTIREEFVPKLFELESGAGSPRHGSRNVSECNTVLLPE
jgi:hypothetical protein